MSNKSQRIFVPVDEETKEQLVTLSNYRQITMAEVIRRLIKSSYKGAVASGAMLPKPDDLQ